MTEQQVAKLRAAGFSDTDINDYAANESKQAAGPQPVDPNAAPTSDLPEIDVTQKSDTVRNAEAAGVSTTNTGSYLSDAAAAGAALAPYAAGVGLTGAGLYGASVAKKGFDAMRSASDARTAQANAQMAQAQGLQQRFEAREAARAAKAMPTPTAGPQILNASGQPMRPVGPVAPAPAMAAPAPAMAAPAAAPASAPSVMQRGTDIANQMRQFAAQRVIPVAQQAGQMAGRGLSAIANSPIARVGGTIANAAYSGDLNTGEAAELERRRKMAPTITR
jgi:hypothetical protein